MPGPSPGIFLSVKRSPSGPEQPAHAGHDIMGWIARPDLSRIGRSKGRVRRCEIAVIDVEGEGRQNHVPQATDRLIGENCDRIVGSAEDVAEVAGDLSGADT